MEPSYMNGKGLAEIGHIVMAPGQVRAIVIAISGTFVKVHGFGTKKENGEVVVLDWVQDLPASECVLLEDQSLSGELKRRLGMFS